MVQRRLCPLCCCHNRRHLWWWCVGLCQPGTHSLGDPVKSALLIFTDMSLFEAWLAKTSTIAAQLACPSPPCRHPCAWKERATSPFLPQSRTLGRYTPPPSDAVVGAKLPLSRVKAVREEVCPRPVHEVEGQVLAGTRSPSRL